MAQLFFKALGLVFVLEGIMPFLGPRLWRRIMQQMMIQNDKSLRMFGLVSMLIGLSVVYFTSI